VRFWGIYETNHGSTNGIGSIWSMRWASHCHSKQFTSSSLQGLKRWSPCNVGLLNHLNLYQSTSELFLFVCFGSLGSVPWNQCETPRPTQQVPVQPRLLGLSHRCWTILRPQVASGAHFGTFNWCFNLTFTEYIQDIQDIVISYNIT
jgi:hypothetical protein